MKSAEINFYSTEFDAVQLKTTVQVMKRNAVYSKRTFLHGYDFQSTGEKNETSIDKTEKHEHKPSSLNTLN